MAITTKTLQVDEQQIGRADRAVQTLTGLSRSKLQGLFDHGCVTVNGVACAQPGMMTESGDLVSVCYDPQQGYPEKRRKWVDRTFTIVYEDQHLIVVNKSASVLTEPTEHGERNALIDRVINYLKHSGHRREAFVVHRLDRGVSGLLVLAKSPAILQSLQEQFKQRKPTRLYVAIVAGILKSSSGTYRSHLRTGDNLDQFSTRKESLGQLAITHYRVLKKMRDTTVVEVQLETGRRNQIRVHFAEHGHPVLGDGRYRPKQARHFRWVTKRLALHAKSLEFEHPVTGERLQFDSVLPKSMKFFIGK